MITINVNVTNKIATASTRVAIVCGNSGYQIKFTFDGEWDAHDTKTARFIWNGRFVDVAFTGDTCPVPIISNTEALTVGVYAGELTTTTPAHLDCLKSIRCGGEKLQDEPSNGEAQVDAVRDAGAQVLADIVEARDEAIDSIDVEAFNQALRAALEEAKASGEFDGKGVTTLSAVVNADGTVTEYRLYYTDGTYSTIKVPSGGGTGGADGRGITSITRVSGTGAPGTTDTYEILYTDNTKTSFSVYNGRDGTSVTVTKVTESTEDGGSNAVTFSDGKTLTVKNGSKGDKGDPFAYEDFTAEQLAALKGANGNDGRGIKSVTRTGGNGEAGTTDTYTITYTDNTTSTFTVPNGMDGRTPSIHNGEWWIGDTPLGVKAEGKDGVSITAAYINDIGQLCLDTTDGDSVAVGYVVGRDGEDGTSVTITNVTESDEGGGESVVSFSDGNTLTVKNGRHGDPGSDGNDGVGIANIAKTATNGKVDTYTITLTNGTKTTFTVTNGADGKDYVLTDANKTEIANLAAALVVTNYPNASGVSF